MERSKTLNGRGSQVVEELISDPAAIHNELITVDTVDNQYWVVANFKETQLEDMLPGEPAKVKLDDFPDRTFTGRVDSISPASGAQFALLPPDNATGNFTKIVQRVPVKIVLDSQSIKGLESRIVPGMSAEVNVKVR